MTPEFALDRFVLDVADFPEPGILFKDITPLLADPEGFAAVVHGLAEIARDEQGRVAVDRIVGIEARGFVLAAPVAAALGVGFVPIRKAGKLPRATHSRSYALEYGEATLQIHCDAVSQGERVLLIDDVLATGGTARAAVELVGECGGEVAGLAVLMELGFLAGRQRLGSLPVHALAHIA